MLSKVGPWGSHFPVSLICLTLEHLIEDPTVIEAYMDIEPVATEQCVSKIARELLLSAIERTPEVVDILSQEGLTSEMLRRSLQVLWWSNVDPLDKLQYAAEVGATYIVPYLLSKATLHSNIYYTFLRVMLTAAAHNHTPFIAVMHRLMKPEYAGTRINEYPYKILVEAAEHGNADIVEYALNGTHGLPKVNHFNPMWFNDALHTTASKYPKLFKDRASEYERITNMLILRGASPSYGKYATYATAHLATIHDNVGMLRSMIDADPSLIKDPMTASFLHDAIQGRSYDTARLLIESGVNIQDERALMNVVEADNTELVKLLLSPSMGKPADVHLQNNRALWLALRNGSPKMVQLLLDAGANLIPVADRLPRAYGMPYYVEALELIQEAAQHISRKRLRNKNTLRYIHEDLASARACRREHKE